MKWTVIGRKVRLLFDAFCNADLFTRRNATTRWICLASTAFDARIATPARKVANGASNDESKLANRVASARLALSCHRTIVAIVWHVSPVRHTGSSIRRRSAKFASPDRSNDDFHQEDGTRRRVNVCFLFPVLCRLLSFLFFICDENFPSWNKKIYWMRLAIYFFITFCSRSA